MKDPGGKRHDWRLLERRPRAGVQRRLACGAGLPLRVPEPPLWERQTANACHASFLVRAGRQSYAHTAPICGPWQGGQVNGEAPAAAVILGELKGQTAERSQGPGQ